MHSQKKKIPQEFFMHVLVLCRGVLLESGPQICAIEIGDCVTDDWIIERAP